MWHIYHDVIHQHTYAPVRHDSDTAVYGSWSLETSSAVSQVLKSSAIPLQSPHSPTKIFTINLIAHFMYNLQSFQSQPVDCTWRYLSFCLHEDCMGAWWQLQSSFRRLQIQHGSRKFCSRVRWNSVRHWCQTSSDVWKERFGLFTVHNKKYNSKLLSPWSLVPR